MMLRGKFAVLALGALVLAGGGASAAPAVPKQTPAASLRTPAPPSSSGPLAPGGAAGIKQAQGQANPLWNWAPFGVVGGLALVVVLTGDDDDDTAVSTATN